jgi:exopolysaccharide biosynthesis protein
MYMLKILAGIKHLKPIWVVVSGIIFSLGVASVLTIYSQNSQAKEINKQTNETLSAQKNIIPGYKKLNDSIKVAQEKSIDVMEIVKDKEVIKQKIIIRAFDEAIAQLTVTQKKVDDLIAANEQSAADEAKRLAEEEANKATVAGKVTSNGVALLSATVSLLSGSTTVTKTTTDKNGAYSLKVNAGTYTLSASKSGYSTSNKTGLSLESKESITQDISLSRAPTSTPTSTSSASDSTAYSKYEKKNISSSRGTFTVDMITLELGSSHIKVVTDTASDEDCYDNCPTKSLSSYVSQNGGFAGINGTYFCPADYSNCAGQTNSFFWKVYNSRLGKMINCCNNLGENDPFLAFTSSGSPKYFTAWSQRGGYAVYAGINSKPGLIHNGANVLDVNSLDDKQRTVKSNRGALGLKGTTLYAVVARSATVIDLAEIMKSIGVDDAMNIDGGGSSALIYKGSYKAGPGRSIPNAVIFVEQ